MVKALKGKPFRGYFDHKIGSETVRFTEENIDKFLERIPPAVAKNIALEIEGNATLVPIPNSHVTSPDTANFRTWQLAKNVASASDGRLTAVPALVFSEPQPKSHSGGGSRSAEHFEGVYDVVQEVRGPIVLLDDVKTSGAHLIGAYWKLNAPGTRDVVLACTFGRTTRERVEVPLGIRKETLDVRRFEF